MTSSRQFLSELPVDGWLHASSSIHWAPTRVVIAEGRIAALEASTALAAEGVIAMPALANAHDHGRGLRPLCYGAFDQPLETWFTALNVHPPVDPYLNAAWAFARMAKSGVGLVVHCHMAVNSPRLIEDAAAVCRAAEDVGIRLAFVVPMRDRFQLGYIADDIILRRLAASDRDKVAGRWLKKILPAEEQIGIADEIARRCSSSLVDVLYGPAAPHWCTRKMLELVAQASAGSGRRVHMHCLETRYQREFADATFPEGLFPYLKKIGLLSERLTLAHGVYLTPAEMDMVAEARAIVSLNTCSNLRLRSGIAPAREMVKRAVPIAIGIDALGLDDDEDLLRELRLTHLLHAGISFDEGVSKPVLLRAAVETGARAVAGNGAHGQIAPGMPADILALDYQKLAYDVMPGVTPELEVIFARACARHVSELLVAGRRVVAQGRVLGIDEAAVESEVIAQAKSATAKYLDAAPLLQRLQATLRAGYLEGLHRGRN